MPRRIPETPEESNARHERLRRAYIKATNEGNDSRALAIAKSGADLAYRTADVHQVNLDRLMREAPREELVIIIAI
jgi:hypothetical protein